MPDANALPLYFYRLVLENDVVSLLRHSMDEPMTIATFVDSSGVLTAGNDDGLRDLTQKVRRRSEEETNTWRGYYDTEGYWRQKGTGGTVENGEGPVGKTWPATSLKTPKEWRGLPDAPPAPAKPVKDQLKEISTHLADVHKMLESRMLAINEVIYHAEKVYRHSPVAYDAMLQAMLNDTLAEVGHLMPKEQE